MVPGLVCGDFSTGETVRLVSARCEDAAATSAASHARVDLAAAYRLADRQGFGEGIFNHFTLATPDTDDRYLQIPFGLHWSEVTASCFTEDPRIEAIGQTEIGFLDRVAYDGEYIGLAFDRAEGKQLAAVLGPHNKVLFMGNHGVLVVGETVAEGYDRLYYLEHACRVQFYEMWTAPACEHHFAALKRLLDRRESDCTD
jgi:ribulose-5-phosphate 4-epimerase/fuculose-1-phosphate aldolase